jgi:hypothetical protein
MTHLAALVAVVWWITLLADTMAAVQRTVVDAGGINWTGDTVRTWMQGGILTFLGIAVRLLWTLRDYVRDLKHELPIIRKSLASHEKEIRWLTGKRIAQEAVEEAERQNWPHGDRRHHPRRDRDIVNDAFARTDEHSTDPEDHP